MKLSMVLLLGVVVFASASAQASPFSEVKKNGVLRLASEGAFQPFNFFAGKELKGFEVELGSALAKKMNLKPEWKTYSFDSLLIGLGQDRYDVVAASHAITAEREKAVDFTSPHYCTGGIVVSRAGGPKTGGALSGKIVAVQVGTTYLEHLKKMPGIKEVKTYPKDTDCMQNLAAGRVDAWVTDRFVALDLIKANKAAKLELGDLLFQEKVSMAVSKGNSSLKESLNQALGDLMKNGTYAELSKKYFNQDIRCK